MIHLFGILVITSTFLALFVSMRASHNRILGAISLFAIGAIFVMANFLDKEFLANSQFFETIVLLLFAVHFGCNFFWLFLHKQRKHGK